MTHTPGPWIRMGVNVRTNDSTIRFVQSIEVGKHPDEVIANANLVAAAPDLLEALELAREYLITIAHDENHVVLQKIKEAIAKAKGGATNG